MVDITPQVCVNIGCAKEWMLAIVVYGVGESISPIYIVHLDSQIYLVLQITHT